MEIKLFEVRYVGRCKNRADGSETAYGWCNGTWTVAITKTALYQWFGVSNRPGEAATLYNVLGINQAATADDIKKAYRRMAKQWHPDHCRESDAKTQFQAIQGAYEILNGPKRAKYNAGLALQASMGRAAAMTDMLNQEYGYRSPLRCGHILGQGAQGRGKFVIESILGWQDIVDSRGRTLVSSYVYGAEAPTESWVDLL